MIDKNRPPVYYSEYLQLPSILGAQHPESGKEKSGAADDEMLFIIIHQVYELWFKQILHELNIVTGIFKQENLPNSSPSIYNSVRRLQRVCLILETAVQQMGILETMTPLDFLDFRDLLRPASGFQSTQFKIIEATLGLPFSRRFGKDYYTSQLKPEDLLAVKEAEKNESLLSLINKWLERMPFIKDPAYWEIADPEKSFWHIYKQAYTGSLADNEIGNLATFDLLFMETEKYPDDRSLCSEANRNALFIMLYRDYPLLQLPYELLNTLLELDELLSLWRHRHIHMVQRTIGKRVGTGGSTGAGYLQSAADSNIIFKEIAELTSFLLPRTLLPKLPDTIIKELSFAGVS